MSSSSERVSGSGSELNNQPVQQNETCSVKAGRIWESIQEGAKTHSDKILLAMVATGLAGAAIAALGSTVLAYNHLGIVNPHLNALSNAAAISMIAVGGVSAILGLVALGFLIKRHNDKKKAEEAKQAEKDARIENSKNKIAEAANQLMTMKAKYAERDTAKAELAAMYAQSRAESIQKLPPEWRTEAASLDVGTIKTFSKQEGLIVKDTFYALLAVYPGQVVLEMGITSQGDLNARVNFHNKQLHPQLEQPDEQ